MTRRVTVNILRTFVDSRGKYGNPTGIVIDEERQIDPVDRQKIATSLHFTDTVFVNNIKLGELSFYNPEQETKFAGDSLISTSHYLRHILKVNLTRLICKGGQIETWDENDLTWIESGLEGTPSWKHQQMGSATQIDAITPNEAAKFEHTMVWAWIDEEKGLIRSRTFLPDWGTLEDQGNGSGAMQLAHKLGRRIEISQGLGSVIFAENVDNRSARVGGRPVVDGVRVMDMVLNVAGV